MSRQPLSISPERFEKFRRIIGALARDMGLDAPTTDDVIQDTMLRVMEHYDPDGMPLTRYVHLVARGKVIDILRKCARAPTVESAEPGRKSNLMEEVPAPGGGPRTHVLSMEEVQMVDRALRSLEPQIQRFVELRYEKGLDHKEICRRMNLPMNAVLNLARKSRTAFAGALANYYKTALGDPEKFRVLDVALRQMSDFYKDPFMWRHAWKMTIREITERIRETEPDVRESHIQMRLKVAYDMIPRLKGVGPEGWARIRSLLRIDPRTGWTDDPADIEREEEQQP